MQSLVLLMNLACNDKTDDTASIEDTAVETAETDTEETDTEETDTEEPTEEPDYTVDSSDSTVWVYFNLNDGAIVEGADDTTTDWDIKLQRYTIALNGGGSGAGNVQAFSLDGEYDGYDAISEIPTDGSWATDGDETEFVLGEWYNYDFATHVLTPKDVVYFIQTTDGVFKFRVVDYYNESGESGFLSFALGF